MDGDYLEYCQEVAFASVATSAPFAYHTYMKTTISTLLDAPPKRVWKELQRPALLEYVAAPLVEFEPVDPELFPERWEEDEYRVTVMLFGVVPLGEQMIRISKPRVDDTEGGQFYQLRDDGTGNLISTWDHLISIRETPDSKTVRSCRRFVTSTDEEVVS